LVVAQENIEWQQAAEYAPQVPRILHRNSQQRQNYKKSILVLALFVGMAAFIFGETINLMVVKGAEIRSLEKEISTIAANNALLQVEVDELQSVGRIESAALAMGMEKPTGTVYVAGDLPAVKNQTGAPTQTPAPPAEGDTSKIQKISQIFTSFFASTQR